MCLDSVTDTIALLLLLLLLLVVLVCLVFPAFWAFWQLPEQLLAPLASSCSLDDKPKTCSAVLSPAGNCNGMLH
jgi:hypothetical protein